MGWGEQICSVRSKESLDDQKFSKLNLDLHKIKDPRKTPMIRLVNKLKYRKARISLDKFRCKSLSLRNFIVRV